MKIAWKTRLSIFLLSEAPRTVTTWFHGRNDLKLICDMYRHKQTACMPITLQEMVCYTYSNSKMSQIRMFSL